MRLGVCYYPEHWPETRWATDAQMMRAAGLDVVRIAEFAWARMEPEEGRFDWAWLDRAVDTLSGAGLDVVLGTPTATPPVWLTRSYPDILRRDAGGMYRDHGTRRHYCPNSERYRALSARIVQQMAQRYGQDGRISGWQIDNEFGGGHTARCYCQNCERAFHEWLRARYQSLADLNAAWGNEFWSQTYTAWEQIRPPDDRIDKKSPCHELDYFRFSSDSYVAYQQQQVDILRERAPQAFVTTNFMGLFSDLDQFALARPLDFVTWDSYPTGNSDRWAQMLLPPDRDASDAQPSYAYDVGDPIITAMAHELTRALRQRPFWVMEQQAGHINWGVSNPGIREETVRLWTWHALAAGADTVVYFRWRPTLFAHEQYHSGILHHDSRPAVGHRSLLALKSEREVMRRLTAAPQDAQVALLFSFSDLWALQLQPHATGFGYLRLHFAYFQALHRLGIPVHILDSSAELDKYRLVIAPTAHIVDEKLAESLSGYVTAGGTLLLGIRSGFKGKSNLVTDQPLPGLLRELVGATVTEWQSLPAGVGVELESEIPELGGLAAYWVESLMSAGAETLARYKDGSAAVTSNARGAGKTIYAGFYPSQPQLTALLSHLAQVAGIRRIAELPAGMLAYRRGEETILLNFSDRPLTAKVADQEVTVGPRDLFVAPQADSTSH